MRWVLPHVVPNASVSINLLLRINRIGNKELEIFHIMLGKKTSSLPPSGYVCLIFRQKPSRLLSTVSSSFPQNHLPQ